VVAGHHYRWALERGADPTVLAREWGPNNPALERYPGWWQVYQPALPEEFHSTTFVTERTIAWLESCAGATSGPGTARRPFFLQCSFPDPHHPFTPPGHWWNAYRPEDMPEPATFDDSLAGAPAHLRLIRGMRPSRNAVQMFGPTRELVRHAMAAEFGLVSMLDEGIGWILAALERLGLAGDTVVVFTSDHGEMFGDHGLMLKATMHYQPCLRVPLVIARPGDRGGRTRALESSLDLAQTFLDLAGVAPFADMQGRSLVPLLADRTGAVRDHCYVEEDFPLALHGSPLPLRTRTLITGRYRYSRYSSGDAELYDLEADPGELRNLAEEPAMRSLRAELSERLLDAITDVSPLATAG